MGYEYEKLKSGAILVKDVPLMGPQKLTEKRFKNKTIDRAWMEKGIETFNALKQRGKMPYLWDRHNEADNPAQVIGRLDNLRIKELNGEPWYFADVIITEAEHQQKFLAGKYPSKSVEFQPDSHYLRGLALLDGHEGHFDFEVPDFVPEGLYDELKALGIENPEAETVLCHAKANTATGDHVMTKEEMIAAMQEANKPLLERIEKLEKRGDDDVKLGKTGDVDDDLKAVKTAERDRYNAQLAEVKRQAKIDSYSTQLAAKTGLTVKLARKKLESFESEETMDLYYENAMSKKDDDLKLSIEREHGDSPDLDEEYEEYKRNYPDSTVSLSQYKQLAADMTKPKEYNGRDVVRLADGGSHFVSA